MSLPARQQRVLDGIAETLRLTEPRLTAMFAIFTRLTKNEPPPGREQLGDPGLLAWLMPRARRLPGWRSERGRLPARCLVIFGQMAIAFVVFAVLIGLSSLGTAGCGKSQQPRADAYSVPHRGACSSFGGSGPGLVGK